MINSEMCCVCMCILLKALYENGVNTSIKVKPGFTIK